MKSLRIIWIFALIFSSCTPSSEETKQGQQKIYSIVPKTNNDSIDQLTPEQRSAFDALNKLQVGTDTKNHLYSTFADINHPCFPADTSFTISRSELKTAMEQFVEKHCTNLTKKNRSKLISTSVLAQQVYKVLHCSNNLNDENYLQRLPMSGTWVIPNILGHRDVVLVW